MKRNNRDAATEVAHGEPQADQNNKNNGNVVLVAEPASADLSVILSSLQTMRDGDFSVRLPGSWTGLPGKIAEGGVGRHRSVGKLTRRRFASTYR